MKLALLSICLLSSCVGQRRDPSTPLTGKEIAAQERARDRRYALYGMLGRAAIQAGVNSLSDRYLADDGK